MLRDAVAERGSDIVGSKIYDESKRWPVDSKFFDNMGPIPHHTHQSFEEAALAGQEDKPESHYYRPQLNNVDNNFAYTFMGLEPESEAGSEPLVGLRYFGPDTHANLPKAGS